MVSMYLLKGMLPEIRTAFVPVGMRVAFVEG
jgi:hypothetical protein